MDFSLGIENEQVVIFSHPLVFQRSQAFVSYRRFISISRQVEIVSGIRKCTTTIVSKMKSGKLQFEYSLL